MILLVSALKKDTNYILQILDSNEKIIETYNFEQQTEAQEEMKYLAVGRYTLRLIEDLNKNGKWDVGNYDLKKQPERIYSKTVSDLRANWDVEVIVRGTDFELNAGSARITEEDEDGIEGRKEVKGAKSTGRRKN